MKYIDTEKLIAEIEKRQEYLGDHNFHSMASEYDWLLTKVQSLQQEQPEENKLPSKRTRVNYAICKLQAFKLLRESIVLDGYVYDEGKCYRENLLNYIHAIPESRLTEIRSYLKEKGWWPYDDDADWVEQEQSEVDLEKELDRWRHDHFKGKRDGDYNGEYLERESQLDLARHFCELGFNTRKED